MPNIKVGMEYLGHKVQLEAATMPELHQILATYAAIPQKCAICGAGLKPHFLIGSKTEGKKTQTYPVYKARCVEGLHEIMLSLSEEGNLYISKERSWMQFVGGSWIEWRGKSVGF